MFVCLLAVVCILASLPYSSQECVFTHWSIWGTCQPPPHLTDTALALFIPRKCAATILQRVRTRELLYFRQSDGPCPRLTETEPCGAEETRTCLTDSWDHYATPVDPFHWRIGPWGQCRQLIGQNASCGVGLERRNFSCFDRNGSQSPVSLCPIPGPADARVCPLSCPCQLSPWGHWSPCLAPSCGLTGNRTRFRSVARQPTYGSCPSLWQREECSENVTCPAVAVFEWSVSSDWSDCDSAGSSHRLVLCYRRYAGDTFLSEPPSCSWPRPLSSRYCSPIYTQWGAWGTCGDSCPSLRARERQLTSGVSSQLFEYSLCDTCQLSAFSCSLYNATGDQLYTQPCNHTVESDVILSHWSDWSVCLSNRSSRSRDLMGFPAYSIPAHIPFRITQQRTCNDSTYGWTYSDWSECDCLQGYQTRNVECIDSSGHTSIYCGFLDKPPSNRTCLSECGYSPPCLYSNWSVYSECSSQCGTGTMTRKRIVLRSAGCPHSVGAVLLSEQRCATQECPPSYHWRVKEFGPCIPLSQLGICGPGYRTAGTECVSDSGLLSEGRCGSAPPPPSELLGVPCPLPCPLCVLSQWGPFAPCPSFCGATTRNRTRHIIGSHCPHLATLPLTESLSCPPAPCPSYRWDPVSRWSLCLPLDTLCGRGMRHRAVACLRSDTVPFPASFCPQTPPPTLKECHAPCPVPCAPGPWSPWGRCSASCDGGVRARTRPVLTPPSLGGQQCPPLSELSPCGPAPCPAPEWHTGPWTPCVPPGPACGFGTQQRSVLCLRGSVPSLCPLPSRPVPSRHCYLHCPPDCLQTLWSPWGRCPASSQNRTRGLLRARQGAGLSCGSPTETRACPPSAADWSYSRYAPCGAGTQYRNYSCEYSAGGPAPSRLCVAEWGPPSGLSRACVPPSPAPCRVSLFSDWSACSGTCASPSGVQGRRRYVTDPPRSGGALCPPLAQTRPCFLPCPLPALSRGHWSPCQTDAGTCGTGHRLRAVLCLDRSGPRPLSACAPPGRDPFSPFLHLDRDTRTRAPCSVPCPDSYVPLPSPPPPNCSSLCSDPSLGLLISPRPLGYLLPSPALPPGDRYPEYRTRPCVPPPDTCLSLQWRTSPWTGADRAVWCQARGPGGVRNVSGCDASTRPAPSRARCLPSCPPSSLCSELSGRCQCQNGTLLSGGRCVPLQGCRDSHCPPGQVCSPSQECVSPPPHTSATVPSLGQTPAAVYYLSAGLVSLLILLCLLAAGLLACLAARVSRSRSYKLNKHTSEEGPPDPFRTPVPDVRSPSVLSEPPAYSPSDTSSSSSVPCQLLSPAPWSPVQGYRSLSVPLTPPPPPYRLLAEQAPIHSLD